MATRVVEGKKPYTGGKAISIDENKVISLNLRDENNLIIYDEGDDEIYVDLQLPDGIEPTDAFPVGITTGRVLVADDWDITGTIICAKTTSGDNIKLLYGDNGTLWMDNGTGTFKQIYFKADVDAIAQAIWDYINANMNLKAFAYNDVQGLYDWISQGKFGLVHRIPVQGFKMDVIFPPTNVTTGTVSSWVYRSVYQDDSGQYFEDDETLSFTVSDGTVTSGYNGTTQNIHNEGFLVICSSVAPGSAVEGCVWYDSTNDILKIYDGSQWNAVGGGGGGADIEYKTQAEYNALLPGALTDNKHYFIYSTSGGGGWQPTNPYCRYKFDGDYTDSTSSFGNATGTSTFQTLSSGIQVLQTNGTNLVTLPIEVTSTAITTYTITFWMKVITMSPASGYYMGCGSGNTNEMAFYESTSGRNYYERCNSNNGVWNTRDITPTGIGSGWRLVTVRSNGPLRSDVSLTINATNTVSTGGTSSSDSSSIFGWGYNLGIGGRNTVDLGPISVQISNLIISHSCWTDQELQDMYDQTKGDYGIS